MQRIITGIIIGGLWLLLLISDQFWLFWMVSVLLGAFSIREYMHMTLPNRARRDKTAGIIFGTMPIVAAYDGRPETVALTLFIALFFLLAHTLGRYPSLVEKEGPESGFILMLRLGFAIFYIGFSLAHFSLIYAKPMGKYWLILLTAITVASDSFAYYTGRRFGRTKLCPAISPGKTVEGFFGGILGAVMVSSAMSLVVFPQINLFKICFITIIIVCLSVMGDLTESVIKRTMGVKDSGHILPGHGGVLDRVDSLIIATPVLFYLIHLGFLDPGP